MNEDFIEESLLIIVGKKRKFSEIDIIVYNNVIDYNFNSNYYIKESELFKMPVEYLCEKELYYKNEGNNFMMIQYLTVASKKNHVESMYILGIHYKKIGNYYMMLKYLNSADLLGHVEATFVLGNYYQFKNSIKMIFYYTRAANKSHIESIQKLYCYYLSQNNITLFTQYILMAINLGHEETIFKYAIYNQKTKNFELMKKYYNMLINNLFVKKITTSCLSNSSVLSRTFKSFNKPNNYQIVALCNLGLHYYEKENNSELMLKYCSLSAEYGNVKSMYSLGKYYFLQNKADNNNVINTINMKKYFEMVLKSSNSKAKIYKGSIYNAFGNYYSKINYNKELLISYYMKGHDMGFIPSSYNLAFFYFKEENFDKMVCFIKIVINSDNSCCGDMIITSMFILALYYKYHEHNYNLMCYYYNMAIQRGGMENPSFLPFINNIFDM